MKVCICDDEEVFRYIIKEVCQKYFEENQYPFEITEAESGEEVLEKASEYDLLIMDIEMSGINGIGVKDRLELEDKSPYIVFVTNYTWYMQNAFGRDVIGYIRKEEIEKKMPGILERIVELINRDIMVAGKYKSSDIACICSEKEYVKIYLKNQGEEIERESLQALEQTLEVADFIRVHRKWLVNLKYVDMLEDTKIWVEGMEIPISVRNRKKVEKAFMRYGMKRMDCM